MTGNVVMLVASLLMASAAALKVAISQQLKYIPKAHELLEIVLLLCVYCVR